MLPRHSIAPVQSVMIYPREDGRAMSHVVRAAAWLVERGIKVTLPKSLYEKRQAGLPAACRGIEQDALDTSVEKLFAEDDDN